MAETRVITQPLFVSGRVGIGTPQPLSALHVRQQALGVTSAMYSESSHGYLTIEDEDARLGLFSRNEGGHGSTVQLIEVNAGVYHDQWSVGRLSSGAGSRLEINYGTGVDYGYNTSLFAITTAGLVGIGTAEQDPAAKLHVAGDDAKVEVVVGDAIWSLDDATTRVAMGNTDGNSFLRVGQSANAFGSIGWSHHLTESSAYLRIQTNQGTSPTLALQPDGGRVGVGTSSPTSALQVVGLPVYANNAAALSGGLTAGAFYRTGGDPDPVCVVH